MEDRFNLNNNENTTSERKIIAGRPIPRRPEPPKQEFVKKSQSKANKQPLNDQSKGILFGLLAGFFLLAGITLLILMFIF